MEDLINTLLIISLSGSFGGFIFGIYVGNSYKIRLPITGKYFELGFIGDILVGIAASITIFFVAGALFGLKVSSLSSTDSLIKMIALGVLSGFAGIKILSNMSSQLLERINEINVRVDKVEKSDRANELVRQADAMLNKNPLKAKIIYEKALSIDTNNETAQIGLAKSLVRLNNIEEAISVLSKIIENNPSAERAYYNRACYKLKTEHYTKQDVLNDLEKAISLFSFYQEYAKEDDDFKTLHNDTDFINLLSKRY